MKILVEKYLEKDRKLCAAFMDLEKAYDRIDRKGLWDILRVYGVGGQLLEGIRSFYENASASLQVNGELSESFSVEVGMRLGCMMSGWLFNIYIIIIIIIIIIIKHNGERRVGRAQTL